MHRPRDYILAFRLCKQKPVHRFTSYRGPCSHHDRLLSGRLLIQLYAAVIRSSGPISCVSRPDSNRSSIHTVVSSIISNKISVKTAMGPPAEAVSIIVPVQRRERTESTSLSMTPTVKKMVTAHAKRLGMSFSEFVSILCVNYLKATGQTEPESEIDHPKNKAAVAHNEPKDRAESGSSAPER